MDDGDDGPYHTCGGITLLVRNSIKYRLEEFEKTGNPVPALIAHQLALEYKIETPQAISDWLQKHLSAYLTDQKERTFDEVIGIGKPRAKRNAFSRRANQHLINEELNHIHTLKQFGFEASEACELFYARASLNVRSQQQRQPERLQVLYSEANKVELTEIVTPYSDDLFSILHTISFLESFLVIGDRQVRTKLRKILVFYTDHLTQNFSMSEIEDECNKFSIEINT